MIFPSFAHWQLLEDDIREPGLHFSVGGALFRRVDEGESPPTLRLRRIIPSVWIGIDQDAEEDVDVPYCRQRGISIICRSNRAVPFTRTLEVFAIRPFSPRK